MLKTVGLFFSSIFARGFLFSTGHLPAQIIMEKLGEVEEEEESISIPSIQSHEKRKDRGDIKSFFNIYLLLEKGKV